ncbi:excalibur calcium-binding domain-containing protein [Neotabrizicola sp. VNH66]|uniref:excalibur calcium-binding domain-containing protein n=1 Tax=Neotabrizicola sp. VNH66 TaxID=3400918 RepID=UPI003C046165
MRKSLVLVAACLGLVACGVPQSPTGQGAYFASMSTSQLWSQHLLTNSPLELAFIEAELGARGETSYGSRYLGQKTAAAYERSLYTRSAVAGVADDKNCSDFATSGAAQKFFLAAGGPVSDPHNLDGDGDGLACDWGRTISKVAKSKAYKPASTSRRSSGYSSGRCYVGPRGGTYTLTASGAKNYDGC